MPWTCNHISFCVCVCDGGYHQCSSNLQFCCSFHLLLVQSPKINQRLSNSQIFLRHACSTAHEHDLLDSRNIQFSSVQSLSRVWLFVTPWTAACQASLSITNSQSLPKLMSIESVMPSDHLILCRPLLLLPSIFPSIRVFSNESALHIRWPKYWSFSFSISPSNDHWSYSKSLMDISFSTFSFSVFGPFLFASMKSCQLRQV